MPKFKNKVIRKADGGKYYPGGGEGPGNYNMAESVRDSLAKGVNQSVNNKMSGINKFNDRVGGPLYGLKHGRSPVYSPGMMREGIGGDIIPLAPSRSSGLSGMNLAQKALDKFSIGSNRTTAKAANRAANPTPAAAREMGSIYTEPISVSEEGSEVEMERSPNDYLTATSDVMNLPSQRNKSESVLQKAMYDEAPNTSFPSANVPKTKSGMKKFMDQYGKFIALGALAGTQGKKGMIAAPIIAALPAIMKMLQNRGKKTPAAPDTQNAAHGGLLGNKSAAHPKKKMAGGAIRKFKGGSMNTMKENLVPKYKYGGDMPKGMPKEMMAMMGKKGKATGDMPEHKKMDMGMPIGKMPDSKKMGMAKPKPSSMDQKFAKGGTAKYASGGMCKGYGMAKKIRPTGSMN